MNGSKSEQVHFLQIWITPEREGLRPGYRQKSFAVEGRRGRLRPLASRGGDEGSLVIHQDVRLYDAHLSPGQEVSYTLGEGEVLQRAPDAVLAHTGLSRLLPLPEAGPTSAPEIDENLAETFPASDPSS
ncbi:MAG: hypothetical protein ACJ754_22890 [Pyrinomonadaceae bacterium]